MPLQSYGSCTLLSHIDPGVMLSLNTWLALFKVDTVELFKNSYIFSSPFVGSNNFPVSFI